jgi:hypothetical protein
MVNATQRHTRANPCRVCGGFDQAPRGQGQRCHGFDVDEWLHCSREEYSQGCNFHEQSSTFSHRAQGQCKCGTSHDRAELTPKLHTNGRSNGNNSNKPLGTMVGTDDYVDEEGNLLFQEVRYADPKDFRQRRPDGKGGWIWNLDGTRRVIYDLPGLLASPIDTPVFILEGSKDCRTAKKYGLVATTNPGGALKWLAEYGQFLQGRVVYIIPDNDKAGISHADDVAKKLHGIASSVKIIALPGVGEGGDLTDWIDQGHTIDELWALIDEAPEWEPPQESPGGKGDTPPGDAEKEGRKSQATTLVELVNQAASKLWHDPEDRPWATITAGSHQENWPLGSGGFHRWLKRLFYEAEGKAPGSQAVQDALGVLEGQALFDGPEHTVYTRLAEYSGAIYLDLADDDWRVVEITPDGWRVIDNPPVKFRRSRGMLALPHPVKGGGINQLRRFVNVATDDDWVLLLSWLIAALRPSGPYPVLVLHGEQGSAKSTLARLLREMVDPNSAPLRSEPRDPRDLMIAANNGWVVNLDNLSHIPPWLSDCLCRLATGGGFSTRELYTNDDEVLFDAQRPVIINGIEEVVTRGDLLDRAVIQDLPAIAENERKSEQDFWSEFEGARREILGALLTAVAHALANIEHVKLDRHPRMADFAIWGAAAAPALGFQSETFINAYMGNRESANGLALEASPVVPVLYKFMNGKEKWQGSAGELLKELNTIAEEADTKQSGWPKASNVLSNRLHRLAPNLWAFKGGVDIAFSREGKAGKKLIIIKKIPQQEQVGETSSEPSASSASALSVSESAEAADDVAHRLTMFPGAGEKTVSQNRIYADGSDDADDEMHTHSKNDDMRAGRSDYPWEEVL